MLCPRVHHGLNITPTGRQRASNVRMGAEEMNEEEEEEGMSGPLGVVGSTALVFV